MHLADYLIQRLYAAGCHDLFGVPGDFSLGFLNSVVDGPMNYVGTCNELNAAYAADGYARMKGIGCLCTTYAVGELSAINGVAGAWAESVPVVVITGAPARRFFKDMPLLHHTLGDYLTPYHMYSKITCAQTILDNTSKAASEIERVLTECLTRQKPVYIVVPSDMVNMNIELHHVLSHHGHGHDHDIATAEQKIALLPPPQARRSESDQEILSECVEEIVAKVNASQRPIFIPGIELIRRGLQPKFKELCDKTKIPYVTMLLSKGIIDECSENFVGLYSGARSRVEVQDFVHGADCVIIIGEKLTDFNTGGFSSIFDPRTRIYVGFDYVQVKSHTFSHIYIHDVMEKLTQELKQFEEIPHPVGTKRCVHRSSTLSREEENVPPSSSQGESAKKTDETTDGKETGETTGEVKTDTTSKVQLGLKREKELTMHRFFDQLADYLPENSVLIAETGSSLFSAAEMMLPKGGVFIGQTFYGSIGYTVGACLGISIALQGTDRKVVLLVGDGSFQVTCQDLSTMIRYKCTPTIFVVNNDGYTIERVITDNEYNNIQMWRYAELPSTFGGEPGHVIRTEEECAEILQKAKERKDKMTFVEVVLDRWDCNQLLKDAGKMMAKNNGLTSRASPKGDCPSPSPIRINRTPRVDCGPPAF